MARSSGFKMTRNFRNLLRILGVTQETFTALQTTESQIVFELRAISGKYQPLEQIQGDLEEMDAQVQQDIEAQEPLSATAAADDND